MEAEADAVAEHVLRGEAPAIHAGPAAVSRKCSCGGTCEHCQSEEEGELHRKSIGKTGGAVTPFDAPPIVHDVLSSRGEPLDPATRTFMESRFGQDFRDVRVHYDSRAQESARSVSALAYTVGHDLVFGEGQYAPHSSPGRSLLAHELTHVVQQAGGNSERKVQRQPAPGVHESPPAGIPYEKYSRDAEMAYRRAGLVDAANAVARCRQGNCTKILTEQEAYQAYRTGRLNGGLGEPPANESRSLQAGAVPLLAGAVRAAAAPAAETATTVVAKTALERAAALGWLEGAPAAAAPAAAAPAAAPAAAAVGTVAIPVAFGVYLAVATYDLISYTNFQASLQRQGYVILPHPLGVCISNCHQPAAPTFQPSDFLRPGLDPLSPAGPFGNIDPDLLEKWIEQAPTDAARRQPAPPAPQAAPQPAPIPRSIPEPDKPKSGCTCICRADADDNMPGNIKPGLPLFAFGTATAGNCAEASKAAKRAATQALGMKPKHIGCRCAGT